MGIAGISLTSCLVKGGGEAHDAAAAAAAAAAAVIRGLFFFPSNFLEGGKKRAIKHSLDGSPPPWPLPGSSAQVLLLIAQQLPRPCGWMRTSSPAVAFSVSRTALQENLIEARMTMETMLARAIVEKPIHQQLEDREQTLARETRGVLQREGGMDVRLAKLDARIQ